MDLPTSAASRTKSADALSIQPDSIRISTNAAAGEFARHLADSSRQSDPARREDRSAERRERTSATEHNRRDKEVRDRENVARETEPQKTAPDDNGEIAPEAASTGALPPIAEIDLPATSANTSSNLSAPTPESETNNETNNEANTVSANPANEDLPADIDVAPAEPVAETPDSAAPGLETGDKPVETSANPEKSAQIPASILPAESTQKSESATAGKNDGQPTMPRTGTPTDTPRPAAAASQQQADAASSGSAPDAEIAVLPATATAKPVKGLGQEAAELLADKKSDARQAATAASATPQAPTPPQIPRGGAAPQQAVNLAPTEAQPAPRGGELPSGTQQTTAAATVRIGTLPGQSQPTQIPAMAIALQISRNLQKGINRFEIRLDPPEMGRIDVRMEVRRDGHVMAHLTVEKPETLELLQRDARALQQALNNAGLNADENSLNFSLHDQNAENDRGDIAGNDQADDSTDDVETTTAPIYNVNLSATGGIDIRV